MEHLQAESAQLVQRTPIDFQRYKYNEINWKARMIGIVGPRGVGKTIMVRQHLKLHSDNNSALYVAADSLYFADHTLTDLAKQMVLMGMKLLVIDEIHKYEQWSRELKHIYDFYPELQVIFTGSSILDIMKGQADLSRRVTMYLMQGLSFREYLALFHGIHTSVIGMEQILSHQVSIDGIDHPYPYFVKYLRNGYYPFGMEDDFLQHLEQVVHQTMQVDIPSYAKMPAYMGRKFEQLLVVIAKSVPFKPSMQKLADATTAGRNNMPEYLYYLEKAGMIAQLRSDKEGIRGLTKTDKIYIDNTNLSYMLGGNAADIGNIRETFFMNQMRVGHTITSAEKADFVVDDRLTFEVGGRNKHQQQIGNTANAFIVKDDIETGYMNVLPLWTFGLLY